MKISQRFKSFELEQKMLEQNEKDLVIFLLQTMVDIKDYLKYRFNQESIELPNGYIDYLHATV